MLKTVALHCPDCNGTGKTYKTKKDGTKYKKPNDCKTCGGKGYRLKETNELAGLGFNAPPARKWISYNGFATGKDKLDALIATANSNGMETAKRFLEDVKRLSAVSSYLSSFVDGISTYTKHDGFLHVNLTQHITATGRFLSLIHI